MEGGLAAVCTCCVGIQQVKLGKMNREAVLNIITSSYLVAPVVFLSKIELAVPSLLCQYTVVLYCIFQIDGFGKLQKAFSLSVGVNTDMLIFHYSAEEQTVSRSEETLTKQLPLLEKLQTISCKYVDYELQASQSHVVFVS